MKYYRWQNSKKRFSVWHALEKSDRTYCGLPHPAEKCLADVAQRVQPHGDKICSKCAARMPAQPKRFSLFRAVAALTIALSIVSYAPPPGESIAKEVREVNPPPPPALPRPPLDAEHSGVGMGVDERGDFIQSRAANSTVPKTEPLKLPPEISQELRHAEEVSHLPPAAEIEGAVSARLGEMIVLRAAKTENVQFCAWDIEPRPDSLETVDVVKKIAGTTHYELDGPAKRELHWSSTTPGVYSVTLAVSGPGGIRTLKWKVSYGTIVDGNVLAPARENMALEDDSSFESLIVHEYRKVRDPHKESNRRAVADGFLEVADLIESTNITEPAEMTRALGRIMPKKLGSAYAEWTIFLRNWLQAMSDLRDLGALNVNDMNDHEQACRETANVLRGE